MFLSLIVPLLVLAGPLGAGGAELGDCPVPPFVADRSMDSNIVLLVDGSGSMNSDENVCVNWDGGRCTRWERWSKWKISVEVIKELLRTYPNALMRIDGKSKGRRQGGKVLRPCGTPAEEIIAYLDQWLAAEDGESDEPFGVSSNMGEALLAAGQYLATVIDPATGRRVDRSEGGIGAYTKRGTWRYAYGSRVETGRFYACYNNSKSEASHRVDGSCPRDYPYDHAVTDDYFTPIETTSPIQAWCQKNYVIQITDGRTKEDIDWDPVINIVGDYDRNPDFPDPEPLDPPLVVEGRAYRTCQELLDANTRATIDEYNDEYRCNTYHDDVAKFLYDKDIRTDLDDGDDIPGEPEDIQNIVTYTIGFGDERDRVLENAARQGGGKYFLTSDLTGADAREKLRKAYSSIFEDISKKQASATAVSVMSTSAGSSDYLFRARFLTGRWNGHLEKFHMPLEEGESPEWDAGELLRDRDWRDRKVFTRILTEAVPKQAFSASNSTVKNHLQNLWGVSASEAADVIDYLLGSDAHEETDENPDRKYRGRGGWPLGDIIYSTPVVVGPPRRYFGDPGYRDFIRAQSARQTMLYVGANDGMLHAFRADDGTEAWAFVPEHLQGRLRELTQKHCHKYMVDLTPVVEDVWDGERWRTVLMGGDRLGGEHYFALDVTNPISASRPYEEVGMLWEAAPFSGSKSSNLPHVGKIKVGGEGKWVAIVTSGYNESDGATGKIAAMDIISGAKLAIWTEGAGDLSELTTGTKGAGKAYYAMTSPVAVDVDDDGYLDLIFAGDTEGNFWKFYYDAESQRWRKARRFATSGQPITATPAVAIDEQDRLRIYFGTGKYLVTSDKADQSRNALYGLIERKDGSDRYLDTTFLQEDDLINMTDVISQDLLGALLADAVQRAKFEGNGWYVHLSEPGGSPSERVVGGALIVAGAVFFTSFEPTADVCGSAGDAKLYAVDYLTSLGARTAGGAPVLSGTEDASGGRYKVLGKGLSSNVVFYYDVTNGQSQLITQTSNTEMRLENIDVRHPTRVMAWKRLF